MSESFTNCRSEVGITIGLIDAINSICTALDSRIEPPVTDEATQQALADLFDAPGFGRLQVVAGHASNEAWEQGRSVREAVAQTNAT